LELRLLGAEVFECGGGGASGDLGQRHEFRDGGELAVSGGVASRGGLGAEPCGCGVAGYGCPYNRVRCGRGWVFAGLFTRRAGQRLYKLSRRRLYSSGRATAAASRVERRSSRRARR
jgi:hypothetical protein